MAKLRGYDFWRETLGSPKYIMAPMVDHSELPFRMLGRKYGVDVCTWEGLPGLCVVESKPWCTCLRAAPACVSVTLTPLPPARPCGQSMFKSVLVDPWWWFPKTDPHTQDPDVGAYVCNVIIKKANVGWDVAFMDGSHSETTGLAHAGSGVWFGEGVARNVHQLLRCRYKCIGQRRMLGRVGPGMTYRMITSVGVPGRGRGGGGLAQGHGVFFLAAPTGLSPLCLGLES